MRSEYHLCHTRIGDSPKVNGPSPSWLYHTEYSYRCFMTFNTKTKYPLESLISHYISLKIFAIINNICFRYGKDDVSGRNIVCVGDCIFENMWNIGLFIETIYLPYTTWTTMTNVNSERTLWWMSQLYNGRA